MSLHYVDPKKAVHPLRLKLDDDEIRDFFRRIDQDDDTLTIEEIEAAQDWLFDYIASEKQTHLGEVILQ